MTLQPCSSPVAQPPKVSRRSGKELAIHPGLIRASMGRFMKEILTGGRPIVEVL